MTIEPQIAVPYTSGTGRPAIETFKGEEKLLDSGVCSPSGTVGVGVNKSATPERTKLAPIPTAAFVAKPNEPKAVAPEAPVNEPKVKAGLNKKAPPINAAPSKIFPNLPLPSTTGIKLMLELPIGYNNSSSPISSLSTKT